MSARCFKHQARACRGSHGAGCQKETHQLQDQFQWYWALWGGWTLQRASGRQYAEPSRER